jgi:hypothetical protein
MTPIALTPAARGKKKAAGRSPTQTRNGGHRATVRRQSAPSAPRRVSGPARTARPKPRRSPSTSTPLGARVLAFAKALPDHQLLDRIIRGRVWIPLLGVLLAGIVAMQVEVLKLGAGIGRSIERGTQLQSRNELLRASVAELADDQRIERLAAGMGMVMPAPDAVHFLSLRPVGYVQRAADSIHQPDATAFVASLPAVGAASGSAGTSAAISVGTPTATSDTSSTTGPTSANGG